jgi:preprotein translocase subunit YajC
MIVLFYILGGLVALVLLYIVYIIIASSYIAIRIRRDYKKNPEAFIKKVQDGKIRVSFGGYKGKVRLIKKK